MNINATTSPDYVGLVKFLMEPLLQKPDSLRIDSEVINARQRVWIRVAFEGEDKGRVLGRDGRNLQAIQTVLNTAGAIAGQSVYVDVYNPNIRSARDAEDGRSHFRDRPQGGRFKRSRTSSSNRFQ